jgi:hypothetical protein
MELLQRQMIAVTLADDPANVSSNPQPLDDSDIQESLANVVSTVQPQQWLSKSERKALRGLGKMEDKIRWIHGQMMKDRDGRELSQFLQSISPKLQTTGVSARKYLTHSSSLVTDRATEVLHVHREVSNHLTMLWAGCQDDHSDSSPLLVNVGEFLSIKFYDIHVYSSN